MSGVPHLVPGARDIRAGGDPLDSMFAVADHAGIAQFRVGSIVTGPLDLSVPVTFASPMPSASYEVFFQARSGVLPTIWASGHAAAGFTLNLLSALAATYSYLAIGVP